MSSFRDEVKNESDVVGILIAELIDEYIEIARREVEESGQGLEFDENVFMGWLVGRLARAEGKM